MTQWRIAGLGVAVLAWSAAACAPRAEVGAPLPTAAPADVGMSAAGLARVDSVIEAAIADSAAPGAALAVGRHGRLVRLRGYGRLDWAPDAGAVNDSSIYDMASLSKVVGLTTAMMILTEEGEVDLDARVAKYLPWFTGGGKESVTVRQLLLHRGGFPAWLPLWQQESGRAGYERLIAAIELIYPPGDSTIYSDLGFITLGFVVEKVTGETLDAFLARRVFGPLGMGDTGYNPDPSLKPRIAPTEVDTVFRHEHVHGVVHDENAYALGGVSGHAGLFSSARDLAIYAQMMLNGGVMDWCPDGETNCPASADPVRIVEASTIARFTERQDTLSRRGLGWDRPNGTASSGDYLTYEAFGHTGFTGTSIWMDPGLDVFVVLLTNRVDPTRANQKHIPLRRAVHDAVAQAITDMRVRKRSSVAP
ncbi:MAG: serine hydrolase [Gemmatimonadales bacterium]|jgi:CubicO group peptidase (beta-lactamase class C family)